MKYFLLAPVLMTALLPGVARAQIVVRMAPPPVVLERPARAPGSRYIWVSGYHRWNGARYIWVPGRYVLPPRPGMIWVPAHWLSRGRGWMFVGGHWR